MPDHEQYRPNVGIVIFNKNANIWIGKRADIKKLCAWQMPQGGIDTNELPLKAAIRETYEETVTRNKDMHLKRFPEIKEEIEGAYKDVYDKKILPSMRSMQFAGDAIEVNPSRMFNCSFLPIIDYHCFSETMFLLLSGCGG